MCCTEDVGNDGSLYTKSMESASAFNQSLDSLLSELHNLGVNIAVCSRFGVDHRSNDVLTKLRRHCGEVGAGWVVLHRVRELKDLPDKGSVGDHLGAPVLRS